MVNTIKIDNAITALIEGKDIKSTKLIGEFRFSENVVYFACPGEYPCCHDEMTLAEFSERYSDHTFTYDRK